MTSQSQLTKLLEEARLQQAHVNTRGLTGLHIERLCKIIERQGEALRSIEATYCYINSDEAKEALLDVERIAEGKT